MIDLDRALEDDVQVGVQQTGVLTVSDGRARVRDASGKIFALRSLKLHYSFVVTETRVPFTLRDFKSESLRMEIAHSHAGQGGTKAEFMLISTPSGVSGVITHHPLARPRVRIGDGPSRQFGGSDG